MSHLSTLIALVSLVPVLLAIRLAVGIRGRKRCSHLLPPANQLTWKSVDPVSSDALSVPKPDRFQTSKVSSAKQGFLLTSGVDNGQESLLWKSLTNGGAIDGMLAGLPIVQAISHIDPLVLKAIESSTADHIHNFSSVHSYVEQHFFTAPAMTADGWFERLTGYVAEQKAASVLEAARHHVTFAPTANQPVWDLLVDGHPVQIKEGIAGVKAFLAEHHGISVYTGDEVALAVKDPMVHGLAGLGSDQMHQATHNSIEAVSDVFDPGFHFPVITLAFSCYREAKIFFTERTTFGQALKNIGIDVAGVGIGAYGGAKAGAIAGAILGPIGSAIFGFVGAIAGGVGGKIFSKSIRHASFNEARASYENVIDTAQCAVNTSIENSRDEVRKLQGTYHMKFSNSRAKIEQRATNQIRLLAQDYEHNFLAFANGFSGYLDELLGELLREEIQVMSAIAGSGLRSFLFPSSNDHLRSAIRKWFRSARKILLKEKKLFRQLTPRTAEKMLSEIKRFLGSYIFELASMEAELAQLLNDFESSQRKALVVSGAALKDLELERNSLIAQFSAQVEHLHAELVDVVRSWNLRVAAVRDRFLKEARAIGVDI